MKQKLKQVLNRKQFVEDLANKLKVKIDTIEWYFRTEIPTKHKEIIEKCLDTQIKLDKKVREIEVKEWKKI